MCRVLAVSASGYYAWRQRPHSARVRADAELSVRISAIHQYSHGTYGAPRIYEELLAADIHIGRKRAARLMKAARLCAARAGANGWLRPCVIMMRGIFKREPISAYIARMTSRRWR
jgi:hypothetical protein